MIIGVTGLYASGKDTVAEILQEMNFFHVSFSDILREELKARRKKITREELIVLGKEWREDYGKGILAKKALEKVREGENHVFTSIGNLGELELLQKREDFILVNVLCPDRLRLRRIMSRKLSGQARTVKELRKQERLENGNDPNAQQLEKVAAKARIILKNDSSREKLKEKVHRLVKDWLFKLQDSRPDWDHYFMNIAEQVKSRATCLSAKKGTIIVKEKMIISSGYNGTPKGIRHCTSGGCLRCTSRHLGKIKSGSYSEPCICCHSEENAIVQAAYNGVSTKGAVLYTTFTPCTTCAKMIINAGIREVVAKVEYPDDVGTSLLRDAKIRLRVLK